MMAAKKDNGATKLPVSENPKQEQNEQQQTGNGKKRKATDALSETNGNDDGDDNLVMIFVRNAGLAISPPRPALPVTMFPSDNVSGTDVQVDIDLAKIYYLEAAQRIFDINVQGNLVAPGWI